MDITTITSFTLVLFRLPRPQALRDIQNGGTEKTLEHATKKKFVEHCHVTFVIFAFATLFL